MFTLIYLFCGRYLLPSILRQQDVHTLAQISTTVAFVALVGFVFAAARLRFPRWEYGLSIALFTFPMTLLLGAPTCEP